MRTTGFKKAGNRPVAELQEMIERDSELSIRRHCELLGLHRSELYYTPSVESEENLAIMRRLDEQYLKTPFYGYKKLPAELEKKGYT